MDQSAEKKKNKIDEKRLSILELNEYCLLEIMKWIIAGCNFIDQSNPSKYADMENFAIAVENTRELLRTYHKEIYYHRKLTQLANTRVLRINFSELQSTITNKNEGYAFWKLYANAIRNNNVTNLVILSLDTSSSYPEFPVHFQIVKCALENKYSLTDLVLDFKGYPLDDLSHVFIRFYELTSLTLDVQMSAETLVSAFRSAPYLTELKIMSADIQGRLSDIVPHCRFLKYLTFVPKPNVNGTEYAPLVELPHLSEITIHGAYKNGSLLAMFQAMNDWRRDETSALTVNFTDVLPPSSSVTMARVTSMNFLSNALKCSSDRIELKTSYNFFEISKDCRPIEESLATMNLCAASFELDWCWKRLILQRCLVSDIDNLITVLKQFNVKHLAIDILDNEKTVLPKLLKSLKPDGLFGLKSIFINDKYTITGTIDQPSTRELVKIKTITFLKCSFADWESVEHLRELKNLQTLNITIKRKFEKKYTKELCDLLETCTVCIFIHCCDWTIEFQKNSGISDPGNNAVNTLKLVDGISNLNEVLEALTYRNFKANEEFYVRKIGLFLGDFQNIHTVSEIKTLKKLNIHILNANGIEKLSELTDLEELTINVIQNGSLIKLFDQLASKESSSLQSLRLSLMHISCKEVFMISRIRSLKKLNLFVSNAASCASLTELANSNIEELEISAPHLSLKKLLAAFAERRTTRLRHLKYYSKPLDLMELTELSKHQYLNTLHIREFDSTTLPYLLQLQKLKKLVIHSQIGFRECICLAELKNLESLTVSLNDVNSLPVLCNIKGLKELIIQETSNLLGGAYKAFDDDLKLELLNIPIRSWNELQGITRMKSLKKLFIISLISSNPIQPIELGQLRELEYLYIKQTYTDFGVWSVIESCKNLSTCTIDVGVFKQEDHIVGKVHTLIKSIRDPAIQDPLRLTVIMSINPAIAGFYMLEYIDDAYLKVFYSLNFIKKRK